jgi:hypothetical protein
MPPSFVALNPREQSDVLDRYALGRAIAEEGYLHVTSRND